jgi:hypothetical protein
MKSTALLTTGYVPGAIAAIIALHANYYREGFALGLVFEARIAIELSSFLLNLEPSRDLLIIAGVEKEIVGSIVVDGTTLGPDEAQLRWFVADPKYPQLESQLMEEAIKFCSQKNYQRILISTMAGSLLADRLTAHWGFKFFERNVGHRWDRPLEEQIFEVSLPRPNASPIDFA